MSYTLRVKKGWTAKNHRDVVFHQYDVNSGLLRIQKADHRLLLIHAVKGIEIETSPEFLQKKIEAEARRIEAEQEQQKIQEAAAKLAQANPVPQPVQPRQPEPVAPPPRVMPVSIPQKTIAERALENVMRTPLGQQAAQQLRQQHEAPAPIPEWVQQNVQQETPEQIMERIEQGAPRWPSPQRNFTDAELQPGAY